jgi:hypothetical protein
MIVSVMRAGGVGVAWATGAIDWGAIGTTGERSAPVTGPPIEQAPNKSKVKTARITILSPNNSALEKFNSHSVAIQ